MVDPNLIHLLLYFNSQHIVGTQTFIKFRCTLSYVYFGVIKKVNSGFKEAKEFLKINKGFTDDWSEQHEIISSDDSYKSFLKWHQWHSP